jgi:hypothetical protein
MKRSGIQDAGTRNPGLHPGYNEASIPQNQRDETLLYPDTSWATSTTHRNLAVRCSGVNLLPGAVLANPHCRLNANWSRSIYFAVSHTVPSLFSNFLQRFFRDVSLQGLGSKID